MKKMSYLLLCAALAFIAGCSDNDQQPEKKSTLGLIVPQTTVAANALLLRDGTLANPVSGIPDFNSRNAGGKLLINYRTLSTENGITNIAVTHFAEANDSTFTLDPDSTSTWEPVSLYGKTFSGTYFITDEDSTNTYYGELSFTFGAETSGASTYTYTFTPAEGSPVSGNGEFIWDGGTIEFLNNEDEDPMVPLGSYTFYAHEFNTVTYIYRTGQNASFSSYGLEL